MGERNTDSLDCKKRVSSAVVTRHFAMPIKRSDVIRGEQYAMALDAINKTQHELARLEAEKDLLFQSMTTETQESQVLIPPN